MLKLAVEITQSTLKNWVGVVTVFRFILHIFTGLATFVVSTNGTLETFLKDCSAEDCFWMRLQDVINAYILSTCLADLVGIPNDIKYAKLLLEST